MELEAKKRREKLLALRNKLNRNDEEEESNIPDSEELENTTQNAEDENDHDHTEQDSNIELPTAENMAKSILQQNSVANTISTVDLAKLAPKKPTWDLDRDIAKKKNALEQETRRALMEITKKRLNSSQIAVSLEQKPRIDPLEEDPDSD